jgi:hypothetical protein
VRASTGETGNANKLAAAIPIGTMTVAEISDAIPPAYSKFVASAWLRSVGTAKSAA